MIKEYNSLTENEILKTKEFLDKINIKEINNLLNNMLVLIEDDVQGIITYENYDKTSLIRYFIYKKQVKDETAKLLLTKTLENIKAQGQNDCVIIVDNSFFNMLDHLGFVKQKMIFLEEERIEVPKELLILKIIFDKVSYF